MKPCTAHWAAMRKAVIDRGMQHLVGTPEESNERVKRAFSDLLDGRARTLADKVRDFDPLLAMHGNFVRRVLQGMGPELFMQREEGEEDGMPKNDRHYCPLCIARKGFDNHNTPTGRCSDPECPLQLHPGEQPWDEEYIESCADEMAKFASEHDLLKVH
jgi:hypothetical protein